MDYIQILAVHSREVFNFMGKQSIVLPPEIYRTIDFKDDLKNEFSNLEINDTSNVNTVFDILLRRLF